MFVSVASFLISLFLADRLRRYARQNALPQLEKLFWYALLFTIILYATEVIFSTHDIMKWVWELYLTCLIIFLFLRKELAALRMLVAAFVPYVLVSVIIDLFQVINVGFYDEWKNYFGNAKMLSFIWMISIVFSQNQQRKVAEKERIKRAQEDELNRAIAIRKVELESLVEERTAELTRQKEELEHLLDELRATQSQLVHSEKMASLGELTAGIAHEIQNPLNFVNNFAEVSNELLDEMNQELDNGDISEAKAIASDIKQNLEKINHHGKRADAIVKGMLQHSRTSSGQKEPTDINVLADEYLRLAYHGLRAKDKSFNSAMKTDFDDTLGQIRVVPQDIGRVILNLLTNAFYAVNDRKKSNIEGYEPVVAIGTKRKGSIVEIKVSDNGNGIPENIREKIFQPFYTTKPTGEGTGLGLSMSYDLIKIGHGGDIKVETVIGEGSIFTVSLPV